MATSNFNFGSVLELALWISEAPRITDQVPIKRARNAFIDTVACMLAGAEEDVTYKVFSSVKLAANGVCSVAGRLQTLPAESAALVNGTAAHALDFDDNFLPAVTHASAVLVPALFALGEEIDASGHQLLDAYIVGLQVQAWLGDTMIPAHYAAGWHATSTIGTIGAAAACSRLLSVDVKVALNALSIATSMAGGSKQQFGSMMKPLHAGLAARAGISAARFADNGVEANEDPFTGPWGFLSLHHASEKGLGNVAPALSIIRDGVAQKRFPCCASAHRTLDAVLKLMAEQDIAAEDILKIQTIIPDSNYHNLRFDTPKTTAEARFSMTYCVAVAVLSGGICLTDFTEEAVMRPSVRAFMSRIDMISAGPESDKGDGIWDCPAVTTLSLKNGQCFTESIAYPVGTLQMPFGPSDLANKFFECAGLSLSADNSHSLYECLVRFEQQKVRHVAAQLRGLGGSSGLGPKKSLAN